MPGQLSTLIPCTAAPPGSPVHSSFTHCCITAYTADSLEPASPPCAPLHKHARMPLSALKRGPASPNGMLLQDYTQHSSPDGLVASAGGGSAVTSPDRQRTSADGSSTSTPKRVSFQLPPRPTTSAAATAAGRLLQGGGGSGIGSNSPALRRPQHLAEASAAASVQALQLQHDMPLVFLPDADSPRHRLQPLTVPPLASCRRWPSNEVCIKACC